MVFTVVRCRKEGWGGAKANGSYAFKGGRACSDWRKEKQGACERQKEWDARRVRGRLFSSGGKRVFAFTEGDGGREYF